MKLYLICAFAVLLCVGGSSAQTQDSEGRLRSPSLNFEISNLLQKLYFDHVVAQDDISVLYGSFNNYSMSGGNSGIPDFAVFQQLTTDFISLFAEIGTPDGSSHSSAIDGHCPAGAVNRELG